MNLNLSFALSVAAACLATNVTSASKKSDTAPTTIEAPNASHLRPRSTVPNVDTSLDGVSSSTAASEVHKVDTDFVDLELHDTSSDPAQRPAEVMA